MNNPQINPNIRYQTTTPMAISNLYTNQAGNVRTIPLNSNQLNHVLVPQKTEIQTPKAQSSFVNQAFSKNTIPTPSYYISTPQIEKGVQGLAMTNPRILHNDTPKPAIPSNRTDLPKQLAKKTPPINTGDLIFPKSNKMHTAISHNEAASTPKKAIASSQQPVKLMPNTSETMPPPKADSTVQAKRSLRSDPSKTDLPKKAQNVKPTPEPPQTPKKVEPKAVESDDDIQIISAKPKESETKKTSDFDEKSFEQCGIAFIRQDPAPTALHIICRMICQGEDFCRVLFSDGRERRVLTSKVKMNYPQIYIAYLESKLAAYACME